jgi:hypothetical protein
MNDETVKTTESKTEYSSNGGTNAIKTKEVSTEKKTTVEEKPEKTVIVTTTEN